MIAWSALRSYIKQDLGYECYVVNTGSNSNPLLLTMEGSSCVMQSVYWSLVGVCYMNGLITLD